MLHDNATPEEVVSDSSGDHQLITRWAPSGDGFNFDSLAWRTRHGESWEQTLEITHEDFEAGSDRRRWVSAIHSFDPALGTAILRVAEGDTPRSAEHVHYSYSWREWDLRRNREQRFIRVCDTPHESFEPHEV
jgi:hypothetical protein